MQVNRQDMEGFNQGRAGRLQLSRLFGVAGQFPGFDFIGKLVDPISQGHDLANGPSVVPAIPGVLDRTG